MKKFLLSGLIISTFVLAACGSANNGENGETAEDVTPNERVGLPNSDIEEDSNDEMDANLDNALKELDMVE